MLLSKREFNRNVWISDPFNKERWLCNMWYKTFRLNEKHYRLFGGVALISHNRSWSVKETKGLI